MVETKPERAKDGDSRGEEHRPGPGPSVSMRGIGREFETITSLHIHRIWAMCREEVNALGSQHLLLSFGDD